jgi:hypothetical protein
MLCPLNLPIGEVVRNVFIDNMPTFVIGLAFFLCQSDMQSEYTASRFGSLTLPSYPNFHIF